jgi:hypothetical protein
VSRRFIDRGSVDPDVVRLLGERDIEIERLRATVADLCYEVKYLQEIVTNMAGRIARQSDLLSRKAEK